MHDFINPKYTSNVFYCPVFISRFITLFSVSHLYCKGTTVCWWTLERIEELVRCLSTTNTEAFRCVSDSFATHIDTSDPLYLSEEVCPLKKRETQHSWALLRNAGTWGIPSNGKPRRKESEMNISVLGGCSVGVAIKTANCNIFLESVKLSIQSEALLSDPLHLSMISNPLTDI